MPLMKKVDLDKAAWAWADNIDPKNISEDNIRTAYRLDVPKCEFGKCRRNCRGNPFCLSGLGEAKLFIETTNESYEDSTDLGFRKEGNFVGLKNLGATCYVNSLLQLWFHNISFRNAILNWKPEDCELVAGASLTAVGYLQYMFTLMQFGKETSVDPSDLIRSLGIEPNVQQDAHEFLQLFISFLEDKLKEQSNPEVRNVIQNNFEGEYNYETRCSKCGNVSICGSTFYELQLNVKGYQTLDESFLEFLKEERLEGSDMYSCQFCQKKQVATRRIHLTKLPPVLNLQLNIFYFDRTKLEKKKLNTPIQFPEKLDLSSYLCANGESAEDCQMYNYNLSAVLLHKGTSAYSGHYVANICDQSSGNWYIFNDEAVTKTEGKKLKLTSDDDYQEDDGKKVKKIRPAKGLLSSSNAYMLVYTRACERVASPLKREQLPGHLATWLDEHDQLVDTMLAESRQLKRNKEEDSNLKKTEKMLFLKELPVEKDFEVISVSWLINWIACENYDEFYRVNNDKLVCEHGKLDPDSVTHYKYIDSCAAEAIYKRYGGGPRLKDESLCAKCVEMKCKEIQMTFSISNDQKELASLLRFEPTDLGYWVGKNSLKTWKKKAVCSLSPGKESKENMCEEDCEDEDKGREGDCDELDKDGDSSVERNHGHINSHSPDESERPFKKLKLDPEVKGMSEDEADDMEEFNSEIVCPHGNLIIDESHKRLVSPAVWTILRKYFPHCKEFDQNADPCTQCQDLAVEGRAVKDLKKNKANYEKELLSNLYLGKGRSRMTDGTFYFIPVFEFLEPWRKFIKLPHRFDAPSSLAMSSLLCRHDYLTYNPRLPQDLHKLYLVCKEEWDQLSSIYTADLQVSVQKESDQILFTSIRVCEACVQEKQQAELQELLCYKKAKVFIKKIGNDQNEFLLPSSSSCLEQGDGGTVIRRSARQKRTGDSVLTVCSSQTLMDLKLQLLNLMEVAPFDQHLYLQSGEELSDHQATLASLNVLPNSVIFLKVDEPPACPVEDLVTKAELEHGFKGTGLMS